MHSAKRFTRRPLFFRPSFKRAHFVRRSMCRMSPTLRRHLCILNFPILRSLLFCGLSASAVHAQPMLCHRVMHALFSLKRRSAPLSALKSKQRSTLRQPYANGLRRISRTPSKGKKVTLTISNERAWEYAKAPVGNSLTIMPASGICDDAVYTTIKRVTPGLGTTLYLKKGSSYFVVHVYGFPDQAKAMAMEKTLATQACSKL